MARSAFDFDAFGPIFENELGDADRFSQGLNEIGDFVPPGQGGGGGHGNGGGHGGGNGGGGGHGGGGNGGGHGGGNGGGQPGQDISYIFNQDIYHMRQVLLRHRKEGRFIVESQIAVEPPVAATITGPGGSWVWRNGKLVPWRPDDDRVATRIRRLSELDPEEIEESWESEPFILTDADIHAIEQAALDAVTGITDSAAQRLERARAMEIIARRKAFLDDEDDTFLMM